MISDAVKVCIKHNYEWMKNEFYLLNGLIVASATICTLFNVHDGITLAILAILFFRVIMFMNLYSMRSTSVTAFSWKFMMGLPLSKNEILILNILTGLVLSIPFFILVISFWNFFSTAVFSNPHSLGLTLTNLLFFFALVQLLATSGLIQHPRREYQKKNETNQLVKFLKFVALLSVFVFYVVIIGGWVYATYGLDIFLPIKNAIDFAIDVVSSWWGVPLWICGLTLFYFTTLKVWNNEKLSYKPNTWNPVREYSTIAVCVIVLAIGIYQTDFKTPPAYKGKINTLVFKKDFKNIERELKNHPSEIKPNNYGYTPMMVAIQEGNVQMAQLLDSYGLSLEGHSLKKDSTLGYDAILLAVKSGKLEMLDYMISKNVKVNELNKIAGLYPLHLAAEKCDSKMVDRLIQAGAEVNVLNKKGETPLIVAAKRQCFSGVIALKEAGADFNLKDKSSKMAFDYIKGEKEKYGSEFSYFIEKNTRKPAQTSPTH